MEEVRSDSLSIPYDNNDSDYQDLDCPIVGRKTLFREEGLLQSHILFLSLFTEAGRS